MLEIKKAIIPSAGLGTRFLPLTKILCKELLPLVDRPMIDYVVQDALGSGIEQIIFVLSEGKKSILEYFKKKPKLEGILEERGQNDLLEKIRKNEKLFSEVNLSYVLQQSPKGDGDAISRAKSQVLGEPFGVLFSDDIFKTKIPALSQLKNIFSTSQKPIIGLKRVPAERLTNYGVVKVEKIANHLFKIKDIIEKPELNKAPSDLAICGRYVLSPDIFRYLDKVTPNKKGEIILAEALKLMLEDGQILYGYEIEGKWMECGKIPGWLQANIEMSLDHSEYGPALREWLKKIKL